MKAWYCDKEGLVWFGPKPKANYYGPFETEAEAKDYWKQCQRQLWQDEYDADLPWED